MTRLATALFLVACVLAVSPADASDGGDRAIEAIAAGDSVQFAVDFAHEGGVLTVSRPDGQVARIPFSAGEVPAYELESTGSGLLAGAYNFEIVFAAHLGNAERKALQQARARGEEPAAIAHGRVVSGSFSVVDGAIRVDDGSRESGTSAGAGSAPSTTPFDQVIADDLIVQGSACIGLDCVNNESFGFDTIRLKENNTRIKFDDTSVGSFPSTDWQLTANDSASGGQNKFSIEDVTAAKVPFTVEGGSTTNSIYIDSTGRIGFRTSTPVLDLHVATSNTPGMRLEQNNSGGFAAQTWDMAGNESNFFIRDVTSGSRLPFRIRPGAPTSSIDIASSGNVGIGTASPTRPLEVARSGAVEIGLSNTSTSGGVATKWFYQVDSDANRTFKLSKEGTGGAEITIDDRLDAHGATFKVDGSVQATNVIFSSSRTLKDGFVAVDPLSILSRVAGIPISTWKYKTDKAGIRHLGPMAEDFAANFGLGADNRTISVTDVNGVALAAIQGLNSLLVEKDHELADLKQRLEKLEARLPAQN